MLEIYDSGHEAGIEPKTPETVVVTPPTLPRAGAIHDTVHRCNMKYSTCMRSVCVAFISVIMKGQVHKGE